jgi:acyl-CoA thioesterase
MNAPANPDPRCPQEIARHAAEIMFANDHATKGLEIEILSISPGHAALAMTIRESMMNGHDTAHGGFIFALADSCFAYACNSHGQVTVASQCSITFVRPVKRGDRLVATAKEVSRYGRSGIYDVSVTVDGVLPVAEFRGWSRTVGGSFIDNGE